MTQQTTTLGNMICCEPNANMSTKANLFGKSSNNNTSSTTGNKYLSTQLTVVSTERELKAFATNAQTTQIKFDIDRGNNITKNYVDYKQGLQTQGSKKLAEKKAKLRAEFFQIKPNKERTNNSTSNSVQEKKQTIDCKYFPKVQQLVEKFDSVRKQKQVIPKMIVNNNETSVIFNLKTESLQQQHRHSPISDEGCNLAHSPYCSSDEDNDSMCTASTAIEQPVISTKHKEKVSRSASSDSALGLEADENVITLAAELQQKKRRMTLTVTDLPLRPALLPLAEPTALPDSHTTVEIKQSLQTLTTQTTVPTKVLLEERVVELPLDDPINSRTCSRRESAQSCLSDYPPSECSGVRYMRTPSVVVSDYSDDIMCGITLEEIEYFRAQRLARRFSSLDTTGTEKDAEGHSDISAASSCSNLYYCGSTISALDGTECYVNGVRVPLEHKCSDASDCSAVCECEDTTSKIQETELNLSNLLAAQHLDKKPANVKKVGMTPKLVISKVDK